MAQAFFVSCCILVVIYSSVYAQYVQPNPRCSLKRSWTSMCTFKDKNCYRQLESDNLAWELAEFPGVGPVDRYEDNYVYLNPALSEGLPKKMIGRIPSLRVAICVKISYATAGTQAVPINFYIENNGTLELVHHVMAETEGNWESTQFSCCLPDINQGKQFAIEATSTDDGIPAIDTVDIHHSNMPCENGELVCYPTLPDQLPLEPDTAPHCPSDVENSAVLTCEFNADDQKNLKECGWTVSDAWLVRQKIDGSGEYNIIMSGDEANSTLISNIEDGIGSLCLEIQFAVPDSVGDDLQNVFSIHIMQNNSSTLWGKAYNYEGRNSSVWKRNSFDAFLPKGNFRQIQITSAINGLKVDYIQVRKSDKIVTTEQPDTILQEGQTLFSCPFSLANQNLPHCDMDFTTGPHLHNSSAAGWIEVETDNTTHNVFPGKQYYLLYKRASNVHGETSIASGYLESYQTLKLTFSYAISGDVNLGIYSAQDDETLDQIWFIEHETEGAWVSQELTFAKDIPFRLIFSAEGSPSHPNTTDPAFVGLTDISVVEMVPLTSTTLLPNTTTYRESTGFVELTTDKFNRGRKKFEDDDDHSPWEMEVMIIVGVIVFFIIFIQVAALTYQRIQKKRTDSDPTI